MEEEMYEAYQKLQEHEQECKYVRDIEIQRLYQELENSIPISVIENEIEELSAMKLTDTIAKAEVNFAIVTLEDIIYEERRRNNTDEH